MFTFYCTAWNYKIGNMSATLVLTVNDAHTEFQNRDSAFSEKR